MRSVLTCATLFTALAACWGALATDPPAKQLHPAEEPAMSEAAPEPLPADTDWSKVDWKKRLTPEQFRVTQQAGTERPFTGAFWKTTTAGEYRCACCDLLLFKAETKFDAGCGWPSFDKAADEKAIVDLEDRSHLMVRTENRCARCGAHLGHLFDDGPTETGMRYCVNSASLRFVPAKGDAEGAKADGK